MKILDKPSVFAAEMNLEFSKTRTMEELKGFFQKLVLRLFEVSSIDDKLIGHIKIYSEGKNGSSIRANLTGSIKNLTVITNGNEEESKLRVWINVITFMIKEEELLKCVKDAIMKFVEDNKEIIRSFELSISDTHENHGKVS
ncbi:MAG: hypothetical protein ACPLY9_03675 [Nitrososphaerales archaeon]